MSKTEPFRKLLKWLRVAEHCNRSGEPAREALERLQATRFANPSRKRRKILAGLAGASALAAWPSLAARGAGGANVGVVGAGFAGLYAATLLAGKGARPQVFEAGNRVGGRVWSLRGLFPGQVAERGAELIDTTHSTLRGLATAYGLTLESYAANRLPGDELFYFGGRHWTEAQVVEEFRAFVPALKEDLGQLSNGPTAYSYNAADRRLDLTPLSEYLDTRGAGPLIRAVLDVAYTIEFGREIDQQSALSLLFFIATNRRQAFTPFGVFSDERFHIVEGNDAVATRLASALPGAVQFGHRLIRVSRRADGRVVLAFDAFGKTVETVHDAAVICIPAPLLREVEFSQSASVPAFLGNAIANYDYGTNSKMMIGFNGRPWWEQSRGNGASYSDLAHHQSTWETNPSLARNDERGVITDYSGGERGALLDPNRLQAEAEAFVADLDKVFPGSAARVRRDSRRRVVGHLENWSRNPLFKGAYSNNFPGYFTTIEGCFSQPAGNLFFAGEHTDSFYSYQGFMEGALLSGARAADQVLRGL